MNPQSPREELEIRITAMLMGELPPDEAAALQIQIAADADLTALHSRLRHASELLREASAIPEQPAAPVPARFSDERRARLLAHFKGGTKPGPVIVKPRGDWRREWKWAVPLGLAASLMALIGGAMFVNGFALRKGSRSTEKMLALSESESLAESAVSTVMSQIRKASHDKDGGVTWASQPGMIRTYRSGKEGRDAKEINRFYHFYSSADELRSASQEIEQSQPKGGSAAGTASVSEAVHFESLGAVRASGATAARGGEAADAPAFFAGSFWDTPRVQTVFDRGRSGAPDTFRGDLASSQPVAHEFQRYPGRPATTSLGRVGTGTLYLPKAATEVSAADFDAGIGRFPDGAFAGKSDTSNVAQGVVGGWASTDNRSVSFGGVISNPEPATELSAASALNLGQSATRGFASYNTEPTKPADIALKGTSFGDNDASVQVSPGATLDLNGTSAVVLNSSITGSGALVKTGGGTLTLTNGNSYTGGTTISGGTLNVDNMVSGTTIPAAPNADVVSISGNTRTKVIRGKRAPLMADAGRLAAQSANTADATDQARFFMTEHNRSPELNLFGRPRVNIWPAPAGKSEQPPPPATEPPAKPASDHFFAESKQEGDARVALGTAHRGLGISAKSDDKEGARDAVAAIREANEPNPVALQGTGGVTFPMTPTTPIASPREEKLALDPKIVEAEGFVNAGKDKPASDPASAPTKYLTVTRNGAVGQAGGADDPIVGRIAFWTDDDSSKVNINTAGGMLLPNGPATISLGIVPQETRAGVEEKFKTRVQYGVERGNAITNGTTDFGTVSGVITSGNAGIGRTTLNKSGAGTWQLNGVNTFSGTTTVNAGTLSVNGGGVLNVTGAAGSNSLNSLAFNGGTLQYSGAGATGEKAAGVTTKSGQRANVEADRKLDVAADFDAPEIPKLIVGKGSGSVSKAGDGTLDLNGRSIFSGDINVAGTNGVLGDLGAADETRREFNKQAAPARRQTEEQAKRSSVAAKDTSDLGRAEVGVRELEEVTRQKADSAAADRKQVDELRLGDVKLLADVSFYAERQIPSPVMFGSLLASSNLAGWKTQLFSPNPAAGAAVQPLAAFDTEAAAKKADAQKAVKEMEIEKLREAEQVAPKPAPNPLVPQPEIATSANAFSTFSLNVSDVAFKLAAASLERGTMPDVSTLRTEEFINAFDYRDPEAAPGAPLAFASERARYPFAQNRDVIRFSVKTAAAGRQPGKPLNVVLLIDNSGSMERADRVRILREGLRTLSAQLQPQDKLSIITFARTPTLRTDGVAGDKAAEATARVGEITPEGGTNLAAALDEGYKIALRHYQPGSINHVVLLTDGAANLGNVDPAAMKQKVEAHRKQGIALDCFGIGWEGLNDDMLEQLSRNGDGRYGFINTPEEAATNFAGQLAGALRVAASDVKVQVEWNPKRVTAYRQVGYAKHQLTKEQFRDNTVDAAELAAAESGNALYVVEVNPRGEGDLGTVRVRFKVPGTSDYREHEWAVPFTRAAAPLENSSSSLRLAASAAAFSEMLAGSPFATEVTSERLLGLLTGVPAIYGADARPKKLEWMIRQAKSLSGR